MLQFNIKIEYKDYRNLLFLQTLRKPIVIVLIIIALLNLLIALPYFLGYKEIFNNPPVINIALGLFMLLLIPATVVAQTKRTYNTNKFLQEPIKYEFSEEQISVTGESFNTNYKWGKIYKIEEFKDWLLIYQDYAHAQFLYKPQMDSNDLLKLKELIIRKNISRKLLK